MATTADIKNGMCIDFNHDLFSIIEFQHVKPGKGAAFVRTRLKSLTTGRVLENTFPSGAKINPVRVETRPYQFLYKDELGYNFMDMNTFEQITVEKHIINAPQFLMDGAEVEVMVHTQEERPLQVKLKSTVVMKVTYTEHGIKGDTASGNTLKPATVESGATVMVPLFVNVDEKIKIDTESGDYVERVK